MTNQCQGRIAALQSDLKFYLANMQGHELTAWERGVESLFHECLDVCESIATLPQPNVDTSSMIRAFAEGHYGRDINGRYALNGWLQLADMLDTLHARSSSFQTLRARLVMGKHKPPTPERLQRFNNGTACLTGGNTHPDRCVCQEKETGQFADTPHKHYDEPPYSCARCRCQAYEPAVPALLVGVEPQEAVPDSRDHLITRLWDIAAKFPTKYCNAVRDPIHLWSKAHEAAARVDVEPPHETKK